MVLSAIAVCFRRIVSLLLVAVILAVLPISAEDGKCDTTKFEITTDDYRVLRWNRNFDLAVAAEPEP